MEWMSDIDDANMTVFLSMDLSRRNGVVVAAGNAGTPGYTYRRQWGIGRLSSYMTEYSC
jgi:hypothetical protein